MTGQLEFAVYRDSLGKFRWHLRTANGQTIASSQPYNSKDAVEKGIESVKTNVPDATVVYLGASRPPFRRTSTRLR